MAQQPSLGPPPDDGGGPQPAPVALGPAMAAGVTVDGHPIVKLNLLQHPFVQKVVPYIVSIALHGGLILLAILTREAYKQVFDPPKEQIIIPDADMTMTNGPEGGVPHPGTGGDPTRDAAQDKFPDVPKDSKGLADKKGSSLIPSLMTGGASDGETVATGIIGTGGASSGPGGLVGNGTEGDGSGVLAPFGVPGGGGGIAPKSNFLGSRGNARKIAFVCDASGSMVTMFDSLSIELRRAVEKLSPVQSFNIMFFQDQGVAAVDKTALIQANPEGKRRAQEFLSKFYPSGSTNPIPSLELAFRLGPELVYILTDGEFPDNDAVIKLCQQRNADKKIKINTIAFITKSRLDKAVEEKELGWVRVLQQIASDSGGKFRQVSDDDMNAR